MKTLLPAIQKQQSSIPTKPRDKSIAEKNEITSLLNKRNLKRINTYQKEQLKLEIR